MSRRNRMFPGLGSWTGDGWPTGEDAKLMRDFGLLPTAGEVELRDVKPGMVLDRDGEAVAVAEVNKAGRSWDGAGEGLTIRWEDGTQTIPLHPLHVWRIAGRQLSLAGSGGAS